MARSKADPNTDARVAEALAWLKCRGTKKNRDGMARYAIVAPQSFGVTMSNILQYALRELTSPGVRGRLAAKTRA